MITIEKLKEADACASGQQAFLKFFPNGKVSSEVFFKTLRETTAQLTEYRKSYLGWLAVSYPDLKFKERLQLIEQSDDPRHWAFAARMFVRGLTADEYEQLIKMSK